MTNADTTESKKTADNLTGHFLIAMPSLDDGFFNQAVTYVCEHDETGSFGIIINQPTDITLDKIISEMKIETEADYDSEKAVYMGGPVDQGRGFILHRPTGAWSSSLQVTENIALTTSKDILLAIANNQGPEDSIVALGYAGWAAGQLEMEMANNTWLTCPAEERIIFDTPIEQRWKAAAELIGIDLTLLSNETGHA